MNIYYAYETVYYICKSCILYIVYITHVYIFTIYIYIYHISYTWFKSILEVQGKSSSYIYSASILLDFNMNEGESEKQVKKYETMWTLIIWIKEIRMIYV